MSFEFGLTDNDLDALWHALYALIFLQQNHINDMEVL